MGKKRILKNLSPLHWWPFRNDADDMNIIVIVIVLVGTRP